MIFTKKIETIRFQDFLAGTSRERALSPKQYMTSMFAFTPLSPDLLTVFPPEALIGYALVLGTGAICFGSMIFDNYAVKNGLEEIASIVETTIKFILPTGAFAVFAYCLIELMKMSWW